MNNEAWIEFLYSPNASMRPFAGLKIDKQQIPEIIDGIDLLAQDVNLAITERVFNEQPDVF